MSRRLLALVALAAAAAVVLGVAGLAGAQFSDVPASSPYAEAIELLADLEIAEGFPNGTFGINQTLTREQFAVFVTRAMGRESLAESYANQVTGFADDRAISNWARGHVYFAVQAGILTGYPDRTVRPQGLVTQAEALTMLVRALGSQFKAYADARGSWPTGYILTAEELGLTENLTVLVNAPMLRGEMAQALYNALRAGYDVEDGEIVEDADRAWLVDVWGRESAAVTWTGEVEDILPSSNRIVVDGRTFTYDDETEVGVNGDLDGEGEAAVEGTVAEGDQVEVSYSGDVATVINVLRATFDNAPLTDVDTDAGETDYGSVVVDGVRVDVTADTTVLLDGDEVSLADLEDAFEEFQDDWDGAPALATVRTVGDDDRAGAEATYVSVITDNIVEGEIESLGQDSKGRYARIDGDRVYYDPARITAAVGSEVTWLLGSDDVARVALDVTTRAEEFFAIVVSYESGGDESLATFELADGSTRELEVTSGFSTVTANVGRVVFVDVDGSGSVAVSAVGAPDDSGNADAVTSTYVTVDGTTYPLAAGGAIVYDDVADEFVDYDDLEEGYDVEVHLVGAANEIGFIVITAK